MILQQIAAAQQALLQKHTFNLPLMDVLGIPRLCIIMDQVFRTTNHPRQRPTFLAEIFTIMTLIFAGETLLPLIYPSPTLNPAHALSPSSWLTNPTPLVLFLLVHWSVSRTWLNKFVPREMDALWEIGWAPIDALGRSIVVCTFFVDVYLAKPHLADNWYSLTILTWIGVYGGGLIVNCFDMYSTHWKFQTPPELKPWGWTTVDFWVPPVVSVVYLTLLHPPAGLPLEPRSKEDGRAACGAGLVFVFLARAFWNFGGKLKTDWLAQARPQPVKIKTQ